MSWCLHWQKKSRYPLTEYFGRYFLLVLISVYKFLSISFLCIAMFVLFVLFCSFFFCLFVFFTSLLSLVLVHFFFCKKRKFPYLLICIIKAWFLSILFYHAFVLTVNWKMFEKRKEKKTQICIVQTIKESHFWLKFKAKQNSHGKKRKARWWTKLLVNGWLVKKKERPLKKVELFSLLKELI